ncbi:wd-40 repeat protein [Stylonychia lemnae]|uniref:Wd-40 repeat protein n=1 Tax=Stylonychia lemnae TaxID=5949 RepID=A0A078AA75_STYLE|nr:wd-40 repeat protein [Stylonychia lemnae]|eukprot:CDW78462.1 wd-40 repeat protein [Stylonychia lemnae]
MSIVPNTEKPEDEQNQNVWNSEGQNVTKSLLLDESKEKLQLEVEKRRQEKEALRKEEEDQYKTVQLIPYIYKSIDGNVQTYILPQDQKVLYTIVESDKGEFFFKVFNFKTFEILNEQPFNESKYETQIMSLSPDQTKIILLDSSLIKHPFQEKESTQNYKIDKCDDKPTFCNLSGLPEHKYKLIFGLLAINSIKNKKTYLFQLQDQFKMIKEFDGKLELVENQDKGCLIKDNKLTIIDLDSLSFTILASFNYLDTDQAHILYCYIINDFLYQRQYELNLQTSFLRVRDIQNGGELVSNIPIPSYNSLVTINEDQTFYFNKNDQLCFITNIFRTSIQKPLARIDERYKSRNLHVNQDQMLIGFDQRFQMTDTKTGYIQRFFAPSKISMVLYQIQTKAYSYGYFQEVQCFYQTKDDPYTVILASYSDLILVKIDPKNTSFRHKYLQRMVNNNLKSQFEEIRNQSILFVKNSDGKLLKYFDNWSKNEILIPTRIFQRIQVSGKYLKIVGLPKDTKKILEIYDYDTQELQKQLCYKLNVVSFILMQDNCLSLLYDNSFHLQKFVGQKQMSQIIKIENVFINDFKNMLSKKDGENFQIWTDQRDYLRIQLNNFKKTGILDPICVQKQATLVRIDGAKDTYSFYDELSQQTGFINSLFSQEGLMKVYNSHSNRTPTDIINSFKKNVHQELLSYIPNVPSFLYQIALKPTILEEYLKSLILIDKRKIPILIQMNQADHKTPLSIAIEQKKQKSIEILLEILIKFQNHPIFSKFIDNNLCDIIDQNIDLREYFESNLTMFQIKDETYPSPKRFIETICKATKISLFENTCVQTIIDYKWEQYTKAFYIKHFFLFLAFIVSLITDTFVSIQMKRTLDESQKEINQYFWTALFISVGFKSICFILLIYFALYELKTKEALGSWGRYFESFWNILDFILIALYAFVFVIDIMDYFDFSFFTDSTSKILLCLFIFLAFIKFCYFMRILSGFSSLVYMLLGVFLDIRYFLTFYLVFIILFSLQFSVLFNGSTPEQYSGINQFGYFIMAFRLSTGDFDTDGFSELPQELIITIWLIWILAVVILNLILMNFIIAVISQSYERAMQRLIPQNYAIRAEFIYERELFMQNNEISDENFPRYLLLRRKIIEENENKEWQGFVKDIKTSYKANTNNIKVQMELVRQQMAKLNESNRRYDLAFDT